MARKFLITSKCLSIGNVNGVVEQSIREQSSHYYSGLEINANMLKIPNYLQHTFGNNAVQLCSGESFVIDDGEKIWKHSRECQTLFSAFGSTSKPNSVFPNSFRVYNVSFFEFRRCNYRPLSLEDTRRFFVLQIFVHLVERYC